MRYIAADFHADRFSSIFENQLQSWSTDFGFLPPSSRISETAEASGEILQLRHTCFPLSDNPVNRETSQGKLGKYHT